MGWENQQNSFIYSWGPSVLHKRDLNIRNQKENMFEQAEKEILNLREWSKSVLNHGNIHIPDQNSELQTSKA